MDCKSGSKPSSLGVLFVDRRVVRQERWEGSEVGRWEISEVGRWEGSEVARWERWEGSEVGKVGR